MKTSTNTLLAALIASFALACSVEAEDKPSLDLPMAAGPFKPDMESLTQYKCPEWFRDAKFGIWAHWGPQSVPMMGDWYARRMYIQGDRDYKDHLERWGHPSEHGYKDLIPLWKAEKWDPDRLMQLYKKAGAKYFVSMGSHHDNFFLWNSKLHRWNSVNMGPHRDVVGDWQKAAQKYGLKFGVSEHLGASFTWFQPSHGSDKTGPKAGVPYDGADPKNWDLYHFPAEPGDKGWYSNNPKWQQEWYNEIKELVDNYHPDLLYSDGGVPFGNEVGLHMIAHLYNSSADHHNGQVQVVYNCKQKSAGRWVEDLERGIMAKVDPYPWQTDTSIGDWFYNKNWKFRPVSWVIHTLVDNVSKNGNLLLNIVQRPDGSIDPEVERMLEDMAKWTAIHGEAIFGSRPWAVYGEGPTRAKGGSFHEDFKYTAQDVRFTTKGPVLYAIALGWPDDGKLLVRSLAEGAGTLREVSLLGYDGKLDWHQTAQGLEVTLPEEKVSSYTCGLKIIGDNLKPVPVPQTSVIVKPDADGTLALGAAEAELHGDQLREETRGGQSNIGFWDNPQEWVSWNIQIPKPGTYKVSASTATTNPEAGFVIEVGGQKLFASAPQTGSWDDFKSSESGQLKIANEGEQLVKVRAKDSASWKAINLRFIRLTPAD